MYIIHGAFSVLCIKFVTFYLTHRLTRFSPRYICNEIKVNDDTISLSGEVMSGAVGYVGYSYKFYDDSIYIKMISDFPQHNSTWYFDINITDKKIKTINKIVFWHEEEKYQKTIWGRNNGLGDEQEIRNSDITCENVIVQDDYMKFQGSFEAKGFGYSSCVYQYANNVLYLMPQMNLIPDYAENNKIIVEIKGEMIGNVNKIVIGRADEASNQVVWDRESGFIGSKGEKGYIVPMLGYSFTFIVKRGFIGDGD
jgi:hypothetical protein